MDGAEELHHTGEGSTIVLLSEGVGVYVCPPVTTRDTSEAPVTVGAEWVLPTGATTGDRLGDRTLPT